ncbi:MAG: hypothetical protein JXN64_05595 [Spirochaetes bacterium]|nr:hypothetical protein [Spirochaetota bacterium]
MRAIPIKIKRLIIWLAIYSVLSVVITVFVMRLIPKVTASPVSVHSVLVETVILTFSIAFLCTPAGYCAIHLLRRKTNFIRIPIVLLSVLCATAAGNAIGRYLVEILRKDTRHWLMFNDLGLNLLLAAGIAILTMIIKDLIREKNELVKDFNNRLVSFLIISYI